MMVELSQFDPGPCELGEGPLWAPPEQALYWHDVIGRRLYRRRREADGADSWDLPNIPGSFGMRKNGGFIAAYRNQLALFDPGSGENIPVEGHGIDFSVERFNDGACDARGRFWAGTFDPSMTTDRGGLYRIDPDLTVRRLDGGINMANGIAWSPDGTAMYFCDSRPGRVYRYDFDLEGGLLGERRVFVDYTELPGRPDGCTVDVEGCLWVAEVTASRISRYDPRGALIGSIMLPVSKPTSITLGGPEMTTLFVTSMRYRLTEEELRQQPLAGTILACEAGVRGQEEHHFAG